jgi:hypothetical protein
VKNLFELKNARRVLIEGNLFERNWAHAQTGFAILFTVRNQSGTAPWSTVEDVTFRHNVLRSSGSAINILGRDETFPAGSRQTSRIWIHNNLFVDIGGGWGGGGRLFQLLGGTKDIIIEHNTARHTGGVIVAEGTPHQNFAYRYNISSHNAYGVIGTGTGVGLPTLTRYFPGAVFAGNVLSDNPKLARNYPADNFFPETFRDVGFTDLEHGDYRLTAPSPFRGAAPGGLDLGVDIPALASAMGALGVPKW